MPSGFTLYYTSNFFSKNMLLDLRHWHLFAAASQLYDLSMITRKATRVFGRVSSSHKNATLMILQRTSAYLH